jgi:hypothetical protein
MKTSATYLPTIGRIAILLVEILKLLLDTYFAFVDHERNRNRYCQRFERDHQHKPQRSAANNCNRGNGHSANDM